MFFLPPNFPSFLSFYIFPFCSSFVLIGLKQNKVFEKPHDTSTSSVLLGEAELEIVPRRRTEATQPQLSLPRESSAVEKGDDEDVVEETPIKVFSRRAVTAQKGSRKRLELGERVESGEDGADEVSKRSPKTAESARERATKRKASSTVVERSGDNAASKRTRQSGGANKRKGSSEEKEQNGQLKKGKGVSSTAKKKAVKDKYDPSTFF